MSFKIIKMLIEIIIGILLAAISVAIVNKVYPNKDHAFWQMGLLIAAFIYVGFAIIGKSWSHLPVELIGVVLYGTFVWLSKKYTLYWLAVGWALHICWDIFLHNGTDTAFVPSWYPAVCLGFDIVIALYIVWLFQKRNMEIGD
jgi:hypothetical protein